MVFHNNNINNNIQGRLIVIKYNLSTNDTKTVTAVAGNAYPTNSNDIGKHNMLGGNYGHYDNCVRSTTYWVVIAATTIIINNNVLIK